MAGQGAKKRGNKKKAQAKSKAKKAAKARSKFLATLPPISEDDLLAFQLQHFGDDSKPENWFVEKEIAIQGYEEDDGLGHYEDGVKRTLTDEQIAIFRRTELWHMKQNQKLKKEERRDNEDLITDHAASPISDASSLEDDLLAHATIKRNDSLASPPSRSETTVSSAARKRHRAEEVPYDQRHKRKWEEYIEEVDEEVGSLTHRRMAREMDELQAEPIEMDY